jgi:hypothetical protein
MLLSAAKVNKRLDGRSNILRSLPTSVDDMSRQITIYESTINVETDMAANVYLYLNEYQYPETTKQRLSIDPMQGVRY